MAVLDTLGVHITLGLEEGLAVLRVNGHVCDIPQRHAVPVVGSVVAVAGRHGLVVDTCSATCKVLWFVTTAKEWVLTDDVESVECDTCTLHTDTFSMATYVQSADGSCGMRSSDVVHIAQVAGSCNRSPPHCYGGSRYMQPYRRATQQHRAHMDRISRNLYERLRWWENMQALAATSKILDYLVGCV